MISRGISLSTCCVQDIPFFSNVLSEQKAVATWSRCILLLPCFLCWNEAVEHLRSDNPILNNLCLVLPEIHGVPFLDVAAKIPCPWYIVNLCISSPSNSTSLGIRIYYICHVSKDVSDMLVNEVKFTPTTVLCGKVFCFVTKPCTEQLLKPKLKYFFSLGKFHFLNLG